jgi:hypothetical protein
MKDFRYLFSTRSLPFGFFLTVVLFVFWLHISESREKNVGVLFSNLMALLSIFSGFVASFYFFVASRGNVFLSKIENTNTFDSLLRLTKVSLELSFVSIIFVFFLAGYAPVGRWDSVWRLDIEIASVFLGFLLTGLTVSNFVRCMKLFLKLTITVR